MDIIIINVYHTYMKNRIVGDYALSLSEADAILSKYGWSDQREEVLLIAKIVIVAGTIGLFLAVVAIAVTLSAGYMLWSL